MTDFDNQVSRMDERLFRRFGKPAIYSRGKIETPCTVIVDYDLTFWGETINVSNVTAIVAVRLSEVSDRPRRGDLFTLENSQGFRVDSTPIFNGEIWYSTVNPI